MKKEVSALFNVQNQLSVLQTQLKEKREEFEQRQKELGLANQELTGLRTQLKEKGNSSRGRRSWRRPIKN